MGKAGKTNHRLQIKEKYWLVPVVCMVFIFLAAAAAVGEMNALPEKPSAENPQKKEPPDSNRLVGKWVRLDGGYVIDISQIHPDGKLEASYLNPRPIHISKATVSEIDGMLGVFIKLDDEGYPGCSYALRYDVDHDMMVGIYYQAAIKETFEVVFQRQ